MPRICTVRLEYQPDPKGQPDVYSLRSAIRDMPGRIFISKYRGQIDEQFAFLAFRTAPLVSASTMDAKVVTADMASHLMVWGEIGKPNQREWTPQRNDYSKNDGLYPSGYYLFRAEPPAAVRAALIGHSSRSRSRESSGGEDVVLPKPFMERLGPSRVGRGHLVCGRLRKILRAASIS